MPIKLNRKACLGYALGAEKDEPEEIAGQTLRRMFDMCDVQHNAMISARDRYHLRKRDEGRFMSEWRTRGWRQGRKRNLEQKRKEEWLAWMRVSGQRMGLTQPTIFNGPKIPLTKEQDEETSIERFKKAMPTEKYIMENIAPNAAKGADRLPIEVQAGRWDEEYEFMKVFPRPLHRYPFDVAMPPKKRKKGKIVRGLVY